MMIAAEKKIGLPTRSAARSMTPSLPGSSGLVRRMMGGWCARALKMVSTMITVASTTSPKSMAPTESRFADSPRASMISTAKNRAKGMVAATIRALFRLPRNNSWIRKISTIPSTMLCSTVWVVTLIRSRRS